MCVCSYIEDVAEGTVELGAGSIVIDREGQVVGFQKACLSQSIHLTLQRRGCCSERNVQFNEGGLVRPIDRDTSNLQEARGLQQAPELLSRAKTATGCCCLSLVLVFVLSLVLCCSCPCVVACAC